MSGVTTAAGSLRNVQAIRRRQAGTSTEKRVVFHVLAKHALLQSTSSFSPSFPGCFGFVGGVSSRERVACREAWPTRSCSSSVFQEWAMPTSPGTRYNKKIGALVPAAYISALEMFEHMDRCVPAQLTSSRLTCS